MEYTDYKVHYRIDAEYIVPPDELPAAQMASEERRLQTIVRKVMTRAGGRVLDIGCGSGWLAGMLGKQGNRVVAMDISPVGVRKAKQWIEEAGRKWQRAREHNDSQLSTLNFVTADIYNLPFSDTSFRWVILSEVMEHLHDPDRTLLEIHRVLEEEGRIVITVPHRERIRYTLCIHCNRPTPVNAHLWSFTREEVAARVEKWGFTVVRIGEISNRILEYFRFPWFARWAPYLFWRWGDSLLNRFKHGAYLCVVAEKSGCRR